MICSENCQYPWQCMICERVSDYFIKQCPECQTPKEQFCRLMNTNYELNYQEHFETIGIIEMECNQDRHKQEIIKLKISKISITEIDDNEYFRKEFIIRPLTVPLLQSPQFLSVTQEQANDGVLFENTFQYLNDMDLIIFENRAKAQMFLNSSIQNNLQCPIKQYIELKNVFPFQKPQLTMNDMLRWLKIPFSGKQNIQSLAQQFALTSVVIELLKRSYTFQTSMLQKLQFPIPEEQSRLQGFTNLVLFDLQVACVEDYRQNFNQEIIEVSAQVYDIGQRKIIRNFQEYIKPVDNPIISEFCTKQTGIQQFQINNGISLQQAINQLIEIFKELGRFCIITQGDFDLIILKKEAERKKVKLVRNFNCYINIKKVFPKSLRSKMSLKDPSMTEMLECCGLLQYGNHESRTAKVVNLAGEVDYLIFNENLRFDEKMLQYTCKI